MGKSRPDSVSKKSGDKPKAIGARKPRKVVKAKEEIKTRRSSATDLKSKKKSTKVYTEKELGIPKLNGIVPEGVQKPKGKKGKVFVDDQESLMTILAMVNAEKEGQIESKLMKLVRQKHGNRC